MKNRTTGLIILFSMGTLSYLGFSSAPSNAQTASKEARVTVAPTTAALEQKIERLEKQVAALEKRVEALKQRPAVVYTTSPTLNPSGQPWGDGTLPGRPFQFNGQTYYRILLGQGGSGEHTGVIGVTPLRLNGTPTTPFVQAAPAR